VGIHPAPVITAVPNVERAYSLIWEDVTARKTVPSLLLDGQASGELQSST